MPTWQAVATGRGRNVKYDFTYRRVVFEMFANGTPRSAIGPNIITIAKTTAPWLDPKPASLRVLGDMRFEMRTVVECLGARDAAAAWRLRMLGSDESTKFGKPGLTSNVVAEMTPGGELKVIVLRAVYTSTGGTAEAIAQAIDTKCFGRLRDLLVRWKQQFDKMYPGETWTGPDPSRLCLGRLGGGGALMGDTCNTEQKVKELLAQMIAAEVEASMGADAWAALSEAEKKHATRVHKLDCWQHLRNIFLNEMSKAQAAHVAEELKPWLDEFSSWDRITTDYSQLLRAAYKEFHIGNRYYKGKGREFWVWLSENYPKAFILLFERAEGGRQDLDYDAAIPLYVMRPYMVEFLHTLVYGADHSNILEDFLYLSFRSVEYIAMTRANALIDLLISRPLRWLAGNAYLLDNFSPIDMRIALGLVHDIFLKAADDGSVLLDPSLDIFKSIADAQPLFAEHLKYTFEQVSLPPQARLAPTQPASHSARCSRRSLLTRVAALASQDYVYSTDGSEKYLRYQLVRDELLNPKDASNEATRLKTIEYLQVQVKGGLRKMLDPKLALHHNLPGEQVDVLARADTIGLDATNDRLAESIFGCWDYILRRNPGISMEAASALVQAMRNKPFAEGGALDQLPEKEALALFEMARITLPEMRKVDRSHHDAHDAYVTAKRKSNSQLELDALVKMYALALSFFKRWKQRGVESPDAATKELAGITSNQKKLDWLREQIEMRTIGLGFVEFKPAGRRARTRTSARSTTCSACCATS
jgi:hypothetical protein